MGKVLREMVFMALYALSVTIGIAIAFVGLLILLQTIEIAFWAMVDNSGDTGLNIAARTGNVPEIVRLAGDIKAIVAQYQTFIIMGVLWLGGVAGMFVRVMVKVAYARRSL